MQGGGQLESEGLLRLQAPTAGCRAVAATSTAERTAVLWSDGTVAVYGVPGDARPLLPLPAGSNRDAVVQRRLAGFRLPAGKQQKSSGGSKKRGTAAEPEAAEGSVSMAAIGDKQVAVVGWANGSDGECWVLGGQDERVLLYVCCRIWLLHSRLYSVLRTGLLCIRRINLHMHWAMMTSV